MEFHASRGGAAPGAENRRDFRIAPAGPVAGIRKSRLFSTQPRPRRAVHRAVRTGGAEGWDSEPHHSCGNFRGCVAPKSLIHTPKSGLFRSERSGDLLECGGYSRRFEAGGVRPMTATQLGRTPPDGRALRACGMCGAESSDAARRDGTKRASTHRTPKALRAQWSRPHGLGDDPCFATDLQGSRIAQTRAIRWGKRFLFKGYPCDPDLLCIEVSG